MKTGHCGPQPLAPRLEEVPHLVAEDQHDDADAERPAPDQRVAAERDEDERELREEAELREHAESDDDRRRDLAQQARASRCRRAAGPGRSRAR